MAKKIDPKAKAKRTKKLAIAGGVLFVALLAIQVPKTMKMLNPPQTAQAAPAPVSATSTTPAATTPPAGVSLAAPTLAGTAPVPAAAPAAVDGALANSDPVTRPDPGQLASFEHFVSKDPFSQQVTVNTDGSAPTGTPASPAATPAKTPATTAPIEVTPAAGGASAVPAAPTAAAPVAAPAAPVAPPAPIAPPTSASVEVNGVPETVATGKTFPAAEAQPFFELVSLKATSAKIGIAGGSLSTGSPTVTLTKGKPVTLMNTADGTRYRLVLLSTT